MWQQSPRLPTRALYAPHNVKAAGRTAVERRDPPSPAGELATPADPTQRHESGQADQLALVNVSPADRLSVSVWGAAWLADAADDPAAVRASWHLDPQAPALLPVGRMFDMIEVAPLAGYEALSLLMCRRAEIGPVAVDNRTGRLGFLVAPGVEVTPRMWGRVGGRRGGAAPRHLRMGHFLVVPPPHPGLCARLQWVIAPAGPGQPLTRVGALLDALAHAVRMTAVVQASQYADQP